MTITMPYFMENKEWYYYDEEEHCWKLTGKAPREAIESYEKFYEERDKLYSICYGIPELEFDEKLSIDTITDKH